MRISSEIIKSAIKNVYQILQYGEISAELNLEHPLILQDNSEIENGKVYIGFEPASVFCASKTNSLLICSAAPPEGWENIFEGVISLCEGTPMRQVFNLVLETFAYYERWDRDLNEIINKAGSLNSMLDRSLPIFRNPMLIHNASFVVVAFV